MRRFFPESVESVMKRRRKSSRRGAGLGSLLAVLVVALLLLLAERQDLFDPPAAGQQGTVFTQAAGTGGELEVYFLDVGQGDCELIRIPNGGGTWNLLLDTGEYAYADSLTGTLQGLGVERIDALVCSHPHTDHMGCMARIVQRFEIGQVYMPRLPDSRVPTTPAYEALLNAMEKKGLKAASLFQGVEIACPPGAEIQITAPREGADWEDINNYSAVFRLAWGDTSFLFTGDAETASEKLILEDAETCGWELGSTVLKCGHHGSKTSTSAGFLRAVRPEYAVISCGMDNSYGHPHKGTLEKLSKMGTRVYRTDEDGTVLARSDGQNVRFETGLPSVEGE